MIFLKSFRLPSWEQEERGNLTPSEYPYGIFPFKQLKDIEFKDITIFYGNNGSGKSTLLNLIAQKLNVSRETPFNESRLFGEYVNKHCEFESVKDDDDCNLDIPKGSRIITSEDIFNHIIEVRNQNKKISKTKDLERSNYYKILDSDFRFNSLEDYESLKLKNQARNKTETSFIRERTKRNIEQFSNGETALKYFDYRFLEGKIYLLDEPENSLSPKFQLELIKLIIDCTYYCNCQFIIATHSPFLLSLTDARVYDLDNVPAKIKNWQELDNVKLYHELFSKNAHLFD